VDTQVNRYIRSDVSKENKDNSLFTIWIGVNDMTVLFSKYPLDTPERQSIIDGIMATILYDMVSFFFFFVICIYELNAETLDFL
jgi:hypothetical protein